jgi:glycosyltransferase involved in cell wall biosynthesis
MGQPLRKQTVFIVEIAGAGGISHYAYNLLDNIDSNINLVLYTAFPYELEDKPRKFQCRFIFKKYKTNLISLLKMYFDAFVDKPSTIHVQLSQYPSIVLILILFFKMMGKKVVVTAHNVVPHELRFIDSAVHKLIYLISNKIIVHSNYSVMDLVRKFPEVNPIKIEKIDHGSYGFFELESTQIKSASSSFSILFFGYIRPYKGLDILLRALSMTILCDKDYILNIVGKPVESFDKYQKIIDANGINEKVHCRLGYIPFDEVSNIFCNSSVVVLPYRHIDQSGVLQLAYAFSKPVIATKVGGFPEVVEDGESGFIVPPNDSAVLAYKLLEMINNPKLISSMSQRARELSQTRFSWKNISAMNAAHYL